MLKNILKLSLVASTILSFSGCGEKQSTLALIQAEKEREAERLKAEEIERTIVLNRELSLQKENAFIEYLNIQKPIFKVKYSKKPFETISEVTQKYAEHFVNKKNDFVVLRVPEKIATPELPKVKTLEKARFEKTSEFRARVQKELDIREAELFTIQEKYRSKVENRNAIVLNLSIINSRAEKFKDILFLKAKELQPTFINWAIADTMGEYKIEPKDYNADSEILLATISATNSNYSKDVTFKISPKNAQAIWDNPNSTSSTIDFKIDGSTIRVAEIKVDGFSANLDKKFKNGEKVQFAIQNTNKDFSNQQFSIQSANLKDTKVDRTQFVESKFMDDIPSLIAKTQKAPIDNKKWAFVIGVENYKDADVVPYSKRSAEMFGKVLTHSLGVPKRNIYSLIDEDASTTSIKDNMRRMLENVKDGDTVYFYYSGHGVPNNDGKAYILPQDKFVDYVHEDKNLQLENIYLSLTSSKAGKVVAFVDSCFSGKTGAENDETLFKGKGVAGIYAKDIKIEFDKNKMAVLTAGSNSQFSNMFEDKGHRMFSYYLMREILEGKKSIDTLYSKVKSEVFETSNKIGDRYKQVPEIDGNEKLVL
jgi:hypothetical protein